MPNRYAWWGYAKSMIRKYPQYCAAVEEMRRTSITALVSGMPHGGIMSNPVAAAVERELPPVEKKEMEAVQAALDAEGQKPNAQERLQIIDLVYFRRSHTLAGAAVAANVPFDTVRKWHNHFVKTVGKNFGLL